MTRTEEESPDQDQTLEDVGPLVARVLTEEANLMELERTQEREIALATPHQRYFSFLLMHSTCRTMTEMVEMKRSEYERPSNGF
jgi:hypothetical protein